MILILYHTLIKKITDVRYSRILLTLDIRYSYRYVRYINSPSQTPPRRADFFMICNLMIFMSSQGKKSIFIVTWDEKKYFYGVPPLKKKYFFRRQFEKKYFFVPRSRVVACLCESGRYENT